MRIAVVTGGDRHAPTETEEARFESIISDYNVEILIFDYGWKGVPSWVGDWANEKSFPALQASPIHKTCEHCGGETVDKIAISKWMVRLAAAAGYNYHASFERSAQRSICIAFPGDNDTADCVQQAERAGLEVIRI